MAFILFSAVATPEFKFDPASYGYTDVTPNGNSVKYATGTSMRVPKNIMTVPNVTRVIRYEEYGYQMMDDNTKRAFANVLAKGLGNYNISESEHTHQEEHTQTSSDSRATVYGNGSGSYSVYGGKDGYSTTVTSTHTDGFTYVLIRKDLDQVQVKQEKVKDEGPKLKSW